ncbi:MAG: ComF family protein [Candidatus Aminicenantaceae bacterium]
MNSSLSKLAELIFFPSFCQICSSLLESNQEKVVCQKCFNKLFSNSLPSYCLYCGRFFDSSIEPHLCSECLNNYPPYSLHRSCGIYEGNLRNVILLFKYRQYKILGKRLAHFAEYVLRDDEKLWWDTDIILPVPLHPKRERQRGFNQAQVIAKELSKRIEIEFLDGCLIKKKNNPPQTYLQAENRRKNVQGVFQVSGKEKLKGRTVLLVDDVFTTGSTIHEGSRVLLESGATEVKALTLAQAFP